MAKFIHTMIRVGNLDQSMKFYQDVFGLKETHRLEFDDFSLVYLRDVESGAEIELTWNKGQSEYTHGSGYGHSAFVVEDLDLQFNRLLDLNLSPAPIKEFKRDGVLLARFFFIQDPDGYKIEVLQRGGHYQ
ncbi:VOC family protein [Pseudomonas fluorescens]|jgi:lactoylglutathione lyase|uniref:VOC family protein n=1 Tax=Pseudomonas TaxID=286 RepID=UPI00084B99A2|nr:VOC family protein [Pseudomonas sp. AP19]MBS7844303.1 VOC family protein [Pseudomonas fluorescens]OEC63730.1 lactoylglutathione lyase [Pseudomonas sp. AP19]